MSNVNQNSQFETRMSAIEIRIGAIEAILNRVVGSSPNASRKRSDTEKEKVKAELLKGVPYDKAGLEKLSWFELKMLSAAVDIKSFGSNRADLSKAILAKQKKRS